MNYAKSLDVHNRSYKLSIEEDKEEFPSTCCLRSISSGAGNSMIASLFVSRALIICYNNNRIIVKKISTRNSNRKKVFPQNFCNPSILSLLFKNFCASLRYARAGARTLPQLTLCTPNYLSNNSSVFSKLHLKSSVTRHRCFCDQN